MGYRKPTAIMQQRFGIKVSRAAADVIDGTQTAMFTVAGGHILLTGLRMTISVAAVDAGANVTNFEINPTVGADMHVCADLDLDGAAIGAKFSCTGIIGDAMTGAAAGGGAMMMVQPIIVPVGTIDIHSNADGGVGGALAAIDLWYIPLDEGAYVVTA